MKFSILIVAIAAIVAVVAWSHHQRIQIVSETHRVLVQEAAALGLAVDLEDTDGALLSTKRSREDRSQDIEELAAFAIEMDALKQSGEQPEGVMAERMAEFMDRILKLDAEQLKMLVEEFRSNTEIDEKTRSRMIDYAIRTLASEHPGAALTFFIKSDDLINNGTVESFLLNSTLATWASDDPQGALEWVRENGEKHPDLISDFVKSALVSGAASSSLALGFNLLGELGLEDPDRAIYSLTSAVNSPQERSEFMALWRGYLKTATGNKKSLNHKMISYLSGGIFNDGFEEGSRWIETSDLSEVEIRRFIENIRFGAKNVDRGKWISWGGERLSGKGRDEQVGGMMQQWTKDDPRAAGEWLVQAPEGPVKNASVAAYVKAVAPHDPQVAAQWALTLPPGEKRNEALKSVYNVWPEDDAARAAFMEEHPAE